MLETIRQEDVYQLSLLFRLDTEDGLVTDEVTVWVDAESLRPIRYQRLARVFGRASLGRGRLPRER